MTNSYERGLTSLGDECYAWLLPDGGWGWSNTGLVVGRGESLLVDTLFDLRLTREMLDGIAPLTDQAPITHAFNTHANGDHFYGNELLAASVEIIATEAAAADMHQDELEFLRTLKREEGPVGRYVSDIFGPFDFDSVTATGPTRTFRDTLTLDVGGREVVLMEVGPAHTAGDAIAWVPDARVAYAGDILFIGGTPIVWAGPIDNWITACDRLLALDATTYVPGHGPVTDRAGVVGARDYLLFARDATTERFHRGMSVEEAIDDIQNNLGRFADLGDKERLVQNVINIYSSLDPNTRQYAATEVFQAMAALDGYRLVAKEEQR